MDGPFEYLDRETIENLVQFYTKEFEATQKYYRNRIKADMLGNPVLKFRVNFNILESESRRYQLTISIFCQL